MPNPFLYVDPANVDANTVASLYKKAEEALKIIERTQEELIIPTVNQLRYAGCHLSRYVQDQSNKDELVKAANHCQRAIYDAYEAGIYYFSSNFNLFCEDYKEVVISDVLVDWVEIRQKVTNIKHFVSNPDNFRDTDTCEQYFLGLRDIIDKIEHARDDLNKIIKKQRNQSYVIWLTLIGTVFAALAFFK
jgi:hypothetical protein